MRLSESLEVLIFPDFRILREFESVSSVILSAANSYDSALTCSGYIYDEIVGSAATGTASGFIPSNYITLLTPAATWAINRAALSITADDKSKSMVMRSQFVQLHITASKTERMTV